MNSSTIASWAQVAASIGVVIGLVLVLMQMQQTLALTRADIASRSYEAYLQFLIHGTGENLAGAMAKAATQPEKLTSEEAMSVSYAMRFMTYRQEWLDMMVRTGILREQIFLDGAKGLGSNFIGMTKAGQAWWRERAPEFNETAFVSWTDVVSEEVERTDPEKLKQHLQYLLEASAVGAQSVDSPPAE